MAITREFLDGIAFDTVKQKYYNANKVNACLDELIAGARELLEENERLKSANAEVEAARAEIGDTLLSAKQIAAAIVREANEEAQRVLDDANEEANRLLISAEEQRCMTKSPLSESQLKAIEAFNAQLDALNVSQATQIFRIKQALMKIALDK